MRHGYGHGRGGGCHGGRGGGGRSGRGGLLEPAVLAALITTAAHGYDLRAAVENLTDGFLVMDPGGLYRALRRMEDEGLLVSAWTEGEHGPQRRTYDITDAGRVELATWTQCLTSQRAALDAVLGVIAQEDSQHPPLNSMTAPVEVTPPEEPNNAT